MKTILSHSLLLLCVLLLPGCFTVTGEVPFNGDGRPGSFVGGIRVDYSWPPPARPSGKEPVGKEPVPPLPFFDREPTPAEVNYFRRIFGLPAEDPPPAPGFL